MTHTNVRRAGWLASLALIGGAVFGPTAALAQTGTQTDIFAGDAAQACTGGPGGSDITPGTGKVAWLFVHASTSAPSGTLTANFDVDGTLHADSYVQGGIKYLVVTSGADTLLDFSDTIDGGVLTLSHVCYGPTPTEQPTESPTEQPTESPTEQPTETPTETPTEQPTETPTDQPTATPGNEETPTPSLVISTFAVTPTPAATPTGTVEATTGKPRVTPPSTDASVGGGTSSGGSGWGLAMLILGGLSLAATQVRPSKKRIRRG